MKIAYFITGLRLGGAEVSTINTANKMAERGHQVLLVYLAGSNEFQSVIRPEVRLVNLHMKKNLIGLFQALHRARKTLRAFHPDVIHGQMIHANLFVRLLRLWIRLPKVISSEHSIDIQGRVRMWAYRITDSLSDLNTNVSREATERFITQKAFSRPKSRPMYNGIDTTRFDKNPVTRAKIRAQYGLTDTDFVFLCAGRLTLAKDHQNLLTAFSQVQGAKLILLGKGELQQQIEETIQTLQLTDRVIVAGAHRNINDYYAAADCLVLSSAWEGMPMVVIEAMASELPVITTNVGGADETVEDPQWIVPTKNPAALAQTMQRMIETPLEERNAIGKQNRQKARRFDINHICDEWERLYRFTHR